MTKKELQKLLREIPADLIETSYVVELVLNPKVQMKYNEKLWNKYQQVCKSGDSYGGFKELWLNLPSGAFKIIMEEQEQ